MLAFKHILTDAVGLFVCLFLFCFLHQLQFDILLIVSNPVEKSAWLWMESSVRSAPMALQDHFFSGGFKYWYCGMMFVISSAVAQIYVCW